MTGFDREMQCALEADGQKLRQLTGADHGPWFSDFLNWQTSETRACDCGSFNVETAPCAPNGIRATAFRCLDCGIEWVE